MEERKIKMEKSEKKTQFCYCCYSWEMKNKKNKN